MSSRPRSRPLADEPRVITVTVPLTVGDALAVACPVRWCNADIGQECFLSEHGEEAAPPHSPREAAAAGLGLVVDHPYARYWREIPGARINAGGRSLSYDVEVPA